MEDTKSLYKLMVLYLLNKAGGTLTKAQVSAFLLEKEYTNYITFMEVIEALTEADLMIAKQEASKTFLTITKEGQDTLSYFGGRLGEALLLDMHDFLAENKVPMQEDLSVRSEYYKTTAGEYEAHLSAYERDIRLLDIKLSVPDKETAVRISDRWLEKNREVYRLLVQNLF